MGRLFVFASLVGSLLLVLASAGSATGQQVLFGQPEVVPTPPAEPRSAPPRTPQPQYDPIRAAEEAAQRADAAARAAIRQQMAIIAAAPLYSPSIVFPYRVPTPILPPAYGPPRAVRRAQRSLERAGVPYTVYVPPAPWSARLSIIAPAPAAQPLGHEKVRTGPNGYIYRPWYGQPSGQPPAEAHRWIPPAPEAVPAPQPVTRADDADARHGPVIPELREPPVPPPADAGPKQVEPVPEPIPVPPPAPGPQEF